MRLPTTYEDDKKLTSKQFVSAFREIAGEEFQDRSLLIANGTNGLDAWIRPECAYDEDSGEAYQLGWGVGFGLDCYDSPCVRLVTTRKNDCPRLFKTLDAALEFWCDAGVDDVRVFTCC